MKLRFEAPIRPVGAVAPVGATHCREQMLLSAVPCKPWRSKANALSAQGNRADGTKAVHLKLFLARRLPAMSGSGPLHSVQGKLQVM